MWNWRGQTMMNGGSHRYVLIRFPSLMSLSPWNIDSYLWGVACIPFFEFWITCVLVEYLLSLCCANPKFYNWTSCLISIDPCNDAMNGCHYLSNYICVYHVLPSTVIIHKMLKITMVRFSTLSHVYDLYGRWFSNSPSESPSLTFFTIPGLLNENGENPSDIPCYCKCRQVWDCHAITHQIDHLSHHLFVGKKKQTKAENCEILLE